MQYFTLNKAAQEIKHHLIGSWQPGKEHGGSVTCLKSVWNPFLALDGSLSLSMKSTIHNNARYCAFILCFIRAHLLINEESHRITLWISMSTQQYCGNDRKYLHIASLIVGCSLPTIWLLGTLLFYYFILFLGLYNYFKQVILTANFQHSTWITFSCYF